MFVICLDITNIDDEKFTYYSAFCCTTIVTKVDNATKYATQEFAEKRLPRINRLADRHLFALLKNKNFKLQNVYVKQIIKKDFSKLCKKCQDKPIESEMGFCISCQKYYNEELSLRKNLKNHPEKVRKQYKKRSEPIPFGYSTETEK